MSAIFFRVYVLLKNVQMQLFLTHYHKVSSTHGKIGIGIFIPFI